MDNRDLKDPVLAEFSKVHPVLAKRLVRNPQTGCLEYTGPSRPIVGNPILYNHREKTTIHLRRYLGIRYFGDIPKGRFFRMKCKNRLCHSKRHMSISTSHANYTPASNQYLVRFNKKTLSSILYFDGKASRSVVAKAFSLPVETITGIWTSRSLHPLRPNTSWRPSSILEQRVENSSIHQGPQFYLSPESREQAHKDVRSSDLPPLTRRIANLMIEGEPISLIAGRVHRSKSGVNYFFRRGLVSIRNTKGNRRWIRIASRDRISAWRKSVYSRTR
jgi:hypothetical protein